MIDLSLQEYELAQPIERLIGGPVCVAVQATWTYWVNTSDPDGGVKRAIATPGVSLTETLTAAGIAEAIKQAIEQSYRAALAIFGVEFKSAQQIRRELMRALIKGRLQAEYERRTADKPDAIDKLFEKTNAARQKALDKLFEQMGVDSIDLLGEDYYCNLEALALQGFLSAECSSSRKIEFDESRLRR